MCLVAECLKLAPGALDLIDVLAPPRDLILENNPDVFGLFLMCGGRGGDGRYVVGRPEELASIENASRDLRHLAVAGETDKVERFLHTVNAA